MTENQARPINILLVEDDDDDVRLIKHSLNQDKILNAIFRVENGVEALEFLRKEGEYSDVPRPDLVLLDLNMPRMDGRETLRAVKEDADLAPIPVVVLTSSDDERDICASYKYKANSYVTKPVDLLQFRSILKEIRDYWFCVVTLPPTITS